MCAPTRDSWTSGECLRLDLTSETLTWDPYDPSYSEMETSMTDFQGHIVANSVSDRGHGFFINSLTTTTTASAADITDDPNFHNILQSHVMIASLNTLAANGTVLTTHNRKPVDYPTLATRWLITPDRTKLTIDRTTQRCVKTRDDSTLSRRFPTKD